MTIATPPARPNPLLSILHWFDSHSRVESISKTDHRIDWVRAIPLIGVHLMCLGVLWVGWSPIAVAIALAFYFIRMFAITGVYHRYFSHRTYKASRPMQFALAVLGNSAAQRGPLWWASHHRNHHLYSDGPEDPHSPRHKGLFWSHIGWITSRANFPSNLKVIPDFARFPELRFLDRFDNAVPVILGVATFYLGVLLEAVAPRLGTNGMQMLVWGFFVSTVTLLHGTVTINSLAHRWGSQRYSTDDDSRNNFFLAMITLGEGWHNNHHHYATATRQGFYWWEIDITYYLLFTLSRLRLIRDLKPVPEHVRNAHRLAETTAA